MTMLTLAKPPVAPLGPILDRVCDLIRTQENPPAQTRLCDRFSEFLALNHYSAQQVAEHLRATYPKQAAADWIAFFIERETFNYEATPTSTVAPDEPAAAAPAQVTQVQDAQTALQPDRMQRPQPEPASLDPAQLLAGSGRSVLVAGRSPELVADVLRSLAKETLLAATQATAPLEFRFIDPNRNPWLGFQCDPRLVIYATLGHLADLVQVVQAIQHVWTAYLEQGQLLTAALRSYRTAPPARPLCLVIHQWGLIYEWAKGLSSREVKAYSAIAQAQGIEKPLSPVEAVGYVKHLVAAGNSAGVTCLLGAQDINSTGLSAEAFKSLTVAAVGDSAAGYDLPLSLLPSTSADGRSHCQQLAQQVKRDRLPLIVSTHDTGLAAALPERDYKDLRIRSAVSLYRHRVSKELR